MQGAGTGSGNKGEIGWSELGHGEMGQNESG